MIRRSLSHFPNSRAESFLKTKRQLYSFFLLTKLRPHNTSANIY
ncbi:hypothetical protein SynPROS91_00111 [Synechococcus sp. PROS-9-1]|nr:hypothetical protein SynPROS91_00111 [Synechococcus sp. PROS-9-1]